MKLQMTMLALLTLTSCAAPGGAQGEARGEPPDGAASQGSGSSSPTLGLEGMRAGYGIAVDSADGPFVVKTRFGAILGNVVPAPHLKAATPRICAAIAKYPPAFLQSVPVHRLVLCSDLSLGRHAAGFADHEAKTVYVNVCEFPAQAVDHETLATIPRTMHHEIFHLLDGRRADDPDWEATNPEGFTYGPEGLPPPDPPPPGFVTPYAASRGTWEDKAEVFAAMMDDPSGLLERARTDAVLRKKVFLLRNVLEDRFPGVPLPVEVIKVPLQESGDH